MAKQEDIKLLRQGVENWNSWRAKCQNVVPIDLREANLSNAYLSDANLSNAYLYKADLSRAKLSRANLSNAKLIRANLSDAKLIRANLNDADLRRADLGGADLSDADLRRANLSGADLREAFARETQFDNIDLRGVKGLETVIHRGPSHISTDTLERSEGDIPEVFLRGVGLSDPFIEYIHSLVSKPIQYYTCFISYSSKDQDFAERLYADLQSNGIRCWYAPEDMDIGDEIQQKIDESIRLYDKLLLVLSQHSIASTWVEYEVKQARRKEPQGIPNVLYPVRLDDTILRCTTPWAQDIQSTRHIGDFVRWKEHDPYQQSFQRLLRALQQKDPRPSK